MILCCMIFFCLLKAFPNCHSVCQPIYIYIYIYVCMYAPLSTTSGGSNHGSPVFNRFRYSMVNSPTHSLKSLDHFLLTVKDKPCHLDQRNVHYITSWEVWRPSYGKQWNNKPTLQRNGLEPTLRSVLVRIALHVVCVCFGWLIDADGDLALINLTKPVIRGEFGQDLKEVSKEKLSLTFKQVAPVPNLSLPLRYWSL